MNCPLCGDEVGENIMMGLAHMMKKHKPQIMESMDAISMDLVQIAGTMGAPEANEKDSSGKEG